MNDTLDALLASVLRARPEPVTGIDLAAEAIRRALVREVRMVGLARLARWTLLSRLAAGILIAITIASGYILWPASTASVAETTTSTSAWLGSTSSYMPNPALVGAVLFLAALVIVAIASLFHADRATPVLIQSV
jgi:hypothetical protein